MRFLVAGLLVAAVTAGSAISATSRLHHNGAIAFANGRDIAEIYESNPDGSDPVLLTRPGIDARWPALSPDGTKLAYAAKQNGNWEVFVEQLPGGVPVDVSASPGFDGYPDWSPDGTKLAYASQDATGVIGIAVHDFATGTTTSLTAGAGLGTENAWHPRWSPDGSMIAFTCDGYGIDVCLMHTDGTKTLVRVTNSPGWELDPTWSPDGSAILYVSYPYSVADIFEIPITNGEPDGSRVRDLTNTPTVSEIQPSWSTSGLIAYRATAPNSGVDQVYEMKSDGSDQHQISPGRAFEGDPNWSHDGSKIVFMSGRNARYDIAVSTSPTTARTLTHSPGFDTDPAWSPDGGRIAFTRVTAKGENVMVMGAGGQKLRNLTRGKGFNWNPAWSPDGKHIAFVRFDGYAAQVWEMNPDGSGQHPLTKHRTWNVHPSWSPDGTRIVYQGISADATGNEYSYLYILDLRTGKERRLPTPAAAETPSWSPDGTWIAYGMAGRIWEIRPSGTGTNLLTFGGGSNKFNDTNPSWSPDSTQIVFTRDDPFGHDTDLYSVRSDGTDDHMVSSLDSAQDSAAWQPVR